MPLKPHIPGTTHVKAPKDFSPGEVADWVRQVLDEARLAGSPERNIPRDLGALKQALTMAKAHNLLVDVGSLEVEIEKALIDKAERQALLASVT